MRTAIAIVFCLAVVLPALDGISKERLPVRSAYDFVRRNGYIQFPEGRPLEVPTRRQSGYLVGDSRDFWSWDLSQMPPHDVLVPSTCRAVGEHSYVFVADDQWHENGGPVTQAVVQAVYDALENQTPSGSIHPGQGLIPNEIEVFGPVPDALDGDPKAIILLMELETYGGTQFDGFFNAFNQYPDDETMSQYGYHSNECEMVTVNSAIRSADSEMTLSILAHEFQHLIHWGGDPQEVAWVDESCAEAAMVVNGYFTDIDWLNDYLKHPDSPLYETEQVHYGACLLFGSYLYERFGDSFLNDLVADPAHGEAGFAGPLAATGASIGMNDLLLDWATATLGDALGATGPRCSHSLLEVDPVSLAHLVDAYPTAGPVTGSLAGTGTAYLRLGNPGSGRDVRVDVQAQPPGRLLWQVLMVGSDGSCEIPDADDYGVTVTFSENPQTDYAYLVFFATQGLDVSYQFTAQVVEAETDGGIDGGQQDGGETDAGLPDAGVDAGEDAGADLTPSDSGPDSGPGDLGPGDYGPEPDKDSGCGCGTRGAGFGGIGWLLGCAFLLWRRRH